MKIYAGNLSYEVTEEDLRLALEEFGQVESVTIIKDRDSGQSKGFGFVEMASKAEGQSAIEGLNGKELKGREINVNEARPRTDSRSSRGGYSGGREGKVVAEEDKAVVEEDTAVAEEDKAAAEEDKGVVDEDQRVAVASNHRHST